MNEIGIAEPWVSIDEVVTHLKVTKDSVYRWIESRALPARKVGRHWRFKLSEVDQWVRRGESSERTRTRVNSVGASNADNTVFERARKR